MEAYTVIKKIHMNCPLCDTIHEVEERKRLAAVTIKGEAVTYEERFYFCANGDGEEHEFESSENKQQGRIQIIFVNKCLCIFSI